MEDKYHMTKVLVTVFADPAGTVRSRADLGDADEVGPGVIREVAAAGGSVITMAALSSITELTRCYVTGGGDVTDRLLGTSLAAALADDDIIKLGTGTVTDRRGVSWDVTFCVDRESHCADLYVHLDRPMDCRLFDDKKFLDSVREALARLGYEGRGFCRAELGMQEDRCVACETPAEFSDWLKKFGYVDLGENEEEEA